MSDLLAYCRDHTDEMVALLKTLIAYKTPTRDIKAVNRFGEFMIQQVEALGATTRRYPMMRSAI